jgi:hypothetical protein
MTLDRARVPCLDEAAGLRPTLPGRQAFEALAPHVIERRLRRLPRPGGACDGWRESPAKRRSRGPFRQPFRLFEQRVTEGSS